MAVLIAALCLATTAGGSDPEPPQPEPTAFVALTFDDGPSGALTERLLDGLRERDAKATFFLCGYRIEQYPSPMDRYLAEGHELGVHSTVHADLTKLSRAQIRQDMEGTIGQITALTGVRPTVMRPPGGAYNDTVLEEAAAEGMSVILWSVDSRDWATRDSGRVLRAMGGKIMDGDVILMHDMSESSVTAALELVDELQAQGVRFVTVSELARLRGLTPVPGAVFRNFRQ